MTESSVPGCGGTQASFQAAPALVFTSTQDTVVYVDTLTLLEESTTFFLQHAANRVASESS
jgi:hypothetical protein